MVKIKIKLSRKVKMSISRVRSYDNLAKVAKGKSNKPSKVVKRRQNYALESVEKAKIAMSNGKNVREVAEEYGIPRQTCYDIKSGKYKSSAIGAPTYLEKDVETILAAAIIQLSKWGFGLNTKQLQMIVRDYLTSTRTPNKFKDNTPGRKWFVLFRKRHENLALRVPQNFPKNRAEAISKSVIENFFNMVKEKYDELDLHNKPTHIFNADETGFSGDQGRQLIFCEKGKSLIKLTKHFL